ncbi:hypothetical protein BX070DRAFT_224701 [Coemansia spiralis]|nr:hypothetical protein BX070DRAFT_224701 [Coemansia spiralis]
MAKKDKVISGKITKPAPKKKTSEIDDIFNTKPAKPAHSKPTLTTEQKKKSSVKVVDATKTDSIGKQKQPPPKDDDFADSKGKNSKYTEDGLRVFYMEDLKIGEGEGETEQCPFDCECCF